tara:strand:+ start:530 stop:940 length:411 start_codon:yes stop_codon:yes gene_type:complete
MDGPWYENQGPNAEEVRKDVLKYINVVNKGNDLYEKEKDKIIKDVLMKIIPDSRNDFGSYRGYSTFGVKVEIANEVIKEVRLEYAKLILQKKFVPICMDKLYNPENGLMMKKTAKNTMVGKKECNDGYWYSDKKIE